jgi:hypothetical protein
MESFSIMGAKRCVAAVIGLLIGCLGLPAQSAEIASVDMPDSMIAGEHNLTLQGGGVREKFFIDLYAAGLYLAEASRDADTIVNAESAMAMRLAIVSSQEKALLGL